MQEIKVYTTVICPFCIQVKRFFREQGYEYTEISLQNDHELRMKLSAENGGWRTVPMVMIGSEFIGGYTEVIALHKKGELKGKVENTEKA